MYLTSLPYHVIQRGNNREACFIESENYQFYLELWKKLSAHCGAAVHAYCLMTNHIHFFVTPDNEPSSRYLLTCMRYIEWNPPSGFAYPYRSARRPRRGPGGARPDSGTPRHEPFTHPNLRGLKHANSFVFS